MRHWFAAPCTWLWRTDQRRDENLLIGMIAFYANQTETGAAYIPHVYVRKDFRSKGIFNMMFHKIEVFLLSIGFERIRLEVDDNNLKAQLVYTNMGFHIENKRGNHSQYMEYLFIEHEKDASDESN